MKNTPGLLSRISQDYKPEAEEILNVVSGYLPPYIQQKELFDLEEVEQFFHKFGLLSS